MGSYLPCSGEESTWTPLSCGVHDLVSINSLKAQSLQVVTCLLTFSEITEAKFIFQWMTSLYIVIFSKGVFAVCLRKMLKIPNTLIFTVCIHCITLLAHYCSLLNYYPLCGLDTNTLLPFMLLLPNSGVFMTYHLNAKHIVHTTLTCHVVTTSLSSI